MSQELSTLIKIRVQGSCGVRESEKVKHSALKGNIGKR